MRAFIVKKVVKHDLGLAKVNQNVSCRLIARAGLSAVARPVIRANFSNKIKNLPVFRFRKRIKQHSCMVR